MNEGTGRWISIDAVSEEINAEPWELYWREFKSGTDEFEKFLHGPLEFLQESIRGIGDDWQIATHFVNHERGLVVTASCWVAMVMPEHKMVLLVSYKHSVD